MTAEIEFTRAGLRTPRAAAIAGIVFALLLGTALVLLRVSVPADPKDAPAWLDDPWRKNSVVLALNLVPFAGLAFLWFIGVIRAFAIVTTTIAHRLGILPRWLVGFGWVIAIVLLVTVERFAWVQILFPVWVLILSIHLLVRVHEAGTGHAGQS